MVGIIGVIIFIVMIFVVTVIAMIIFLRNPCIDSKCVLNYFEPDDIAPELTELIEHHKQSGNKVKYKVK